MFLEAEKLPSNILPFRLLKIRGLTNLATAEQGVTTSVLNCSLEKFHLSKKTFHLDPFHTSEEGHPPYVALSYTWGPPTAEKQREVEQETSTRPRFLLIDAKKFVLSQNLNDFLVRHLKRLQDGYLWVDQICIDQRNVWERNHQVQLMSKIYTQAERVIIWLGEADASISSFSKVASLLATVIDDSRRERDEFLPPQLDFDEMLDIDFRQALKRRGLGIAPVSLEWEGLLFFFYRRWFSRVWTYQEHRLNGRKVLLCGEYESAWDSVVGGIFYVLRSGQFLQEILSSGNM